MLRGAVRNPKPWRPEASASWSRTCYALRMATRIRAHVTQRPPACLQSHVLGSGGWAMVITGRLAVVGTVLVDLTSTSLFGVACKTLHILDQGKRWRFVRDATCSMRREDVLLMSWWCQDPAQRVSGKGLASWQSSRSCSCRSVPVHVSIRASSTLLALTQRMYTGSSSVSGGVQPFLEEQEVHLRT